LRGAIGLQVFEILERMAEIALGGIDAALEAGEGVAAVVIDGAAEVEAVGEGSGAGVGVAFPELRFGAARASRSSRDSPRMISAAE